MGHCRDCAFWQVDFNGRCNKIISNGYADDDSKAWIETEITEKYVVESAAIATVYLCTDPDFGCVLYQRKFRDIKCNNCDGKGYIEYPDYDTLGKMTGSHRSRCIECYGAGIV